MSALFSRPRAPATPDYAGLAQQQGQENERAAQQTALLGSPNEVTPWGSIDRTFDPNTGQFTYTTSLSPDQQRLFDSGQDIDLARMDLGRTQIGHLSDLWSKPFDTSGMTDRVTNLDLPNMQMHVPGVEYQRDFNRTDYQLDPGQASSYQQSLDLSGLGDRPTLDFSGLPDMPSVPGLSGFGNERQRVEDAIYQQQSNRLDPQWQQEEERLRNRLYSQGAREGNPAWTQAFDDLYRRRDAAYENARLSSITGAGQEHSRLFGMESAAFQMGSAQRGQMANEAMAAAGFEMDSRAQGVSEALAEGNFANAVTQLERAYGLDRQAAVNMATQLQNTMELNAMQASNMAGQMQFGQNLAQGQLANTASQQGFEQQLANAMLANTGRAAEFDERAFLRNQPFNEFSAMMSGTGVAPPNFSGPTVSPGVQGAPIYQAGHDTYQAAYNNYAQEMARLNSLWQTIGSVGGTLGSAAITASDRRLKRNIVRIGALKSGLPVYEYDIGSRHEVGVLADEAQALFPDAVLEIGGFLHVDYVRVW